MNQNNRIINGLWIGNKLSALEQLCILSFIQNGHIFQLWTYSIIDNIPEGTIIKNANDIIDSKDIFSYVYTNKFGHGKGSYAGFSDIFRYKLLYTHGGWWTDMDVTCLKPLTFESEYVFRKNGKKGIVGNIMKCPANSNLMKYCYDRAVNEMDANNTEWLLPVNILNDGINSFNLNSFEIEFTNEDSWPLVTSFILSSEKINSDWFAFHWMNEEWRRFQINKNAYIPSSTIENLMTGLHISHEILNETSTRIVKRTLGKWNYRIINIKARANWYYTLLLSKLQSLFQ